MKQSDLYIQTDYLYKVFNPHFFKKTVSETVRVARLLKRKYKFDSIAFRGVSGAALAFILSHKLELPLICVRKREDRSHSIYAAVEGNYGCKKYLIVDDFISLGYTVKGIIQSIEKQIPSAECAAILLYSPSDDRKVFATNWDMPTRIPVHKATVKRKKPCKSK